MVAVMDSSTLCTFKLPYSESAHTFRTIAGYFSATRADLGSPTLGDDFTLSSRRNRLILKHSAQHRPPRVQCGLSHIGFGEIGRANITDVNLSILSHYFSRDNVEKMFALIGYLCRHSAGASLLAAFLEKGEFLFRRLVIARVFNLLASGEGSQRIKSKVYSDAVSFTFLSFGQFNLDIHIPAATAIGRKLKRLWRGVLRNATRQPEAIVAAHNRQLAAFKLGGALEIGEGNPIEVALLAAKSRRLWKTGVASVSKLAANGINRVGVQPNLFGDATAKIGKVKGGWAPNGAASFPAAMGFFVRLTTKVPHEIDSAGLRSQRPFCGRRTIFNSVAVCEKQSTGLRSVSAELWSRGRRALARLTASSYLYTNPHNSTRGSAFLPAMNDGVSSANFR